jgi:ATP-binding cassette subfamily C protein
MLNNRFSVMARLTALIGRLIPVLLTAIVLGVLGYLCASFIMVFAAHALLGAAGVSEVSSSLMLTAVFMCAAARSLLRYFEQLSGHYMAFKLLAVLRDKVFSQLRALAPAKLEQRSQGELVSAVTNDIELLEVFYAHTLAPAAIAVIVSAAMALYIGSQHILLGIIAALGYICVGVVIPTLNFKTRKEAGESYKVKYDQAGSFLLESLYGLTETLRFGRGADKQAEMDAISDDMERQQLKLKRLEGKAAAVTDAAVLLFSGTVLFAGLLLLQNGEIAFSRVLIATVAMMSSFGPVVALSSLSNDLTHTLTAGEQVLVLLDENPETPEVDAGLTTAYRGAVCEDVGFTYGSERVLRNVSLNIPQTGINAIYGESGSGKTTLLKLLMRFWDAQQGRILLSGEDIRSINTKNLRNMEGYVTQDTFLFEGSLLDNIRLSKPDADIAEVYQAAEAAGIHEFICRLPKGYDTRLGELGEGLSAGLGLARAFLHGAPLLLLDEPTSNLDSLNEAVILKSLKEAAGKRSIILVSHRESTLRVADRIFGMSNGMLEKKLLPYEQI